MLGSLFGGESLQTDVTALDLLRQVPHACCKQKETNVRYTLEIVSGKGPLLFWAILARQYHPLLHGFPSAQSVKAGWLTHSWPNARPTNPYLLSLVSEKEVGKFVQPSESNLFFVYSPELFCISSIKLESSNQRGAPSLYVLQRGASSHYNWVGMRKFILKQSCPTTCPNELLILGGTMQLNLWNSIIKKKKKKKEARPLHGGHSFKLFVRSKWVNFDSSHLLVPETQMYHTFVNGTVNCVWTSQWYPLQNHPCSVFKAVLPEDQWDPILMFSLVTFTKTIRDVFKVFTLSHCLTIAKSTFSDWQTCAHMSPPLEDALFSCYWPN